MSETTKTGAFPSAVTQRSPCLMLLLSCIDVLGAVQNKPGYEDMNPEFREVSMGVTKLVTEQ